MRPTRRNGMPAAVRPIRHKVNKQPTAPGPAPGRHASMFDCHQGAPSRLKPNVGPHWEEAIPRRGDHQGGRVAGGLIEAVLTLTCLTKGYCLLDRPLFLARECSRRETRGGLLVVQVEWEPVPPPLIRWHR